MREIHIIINVCITNKWEFECDMKEVINWRLLKNIEEEEQASDDIGSMIFYIGAGIIGGAFVGMLFVGNLIEECFNMRITRRKNKNEVNKNEVYIYDDRINWLTIDDDTVYKPAGEHRKSISMAECEPDEELSESDLMISRKADIDRSEEFSQASQNPWHTINDEKSLKQDDGKIFQK